MSIEKNRLYIDLIHGRKFNTKQREIIKSAIDTGLNISQLSQLVRENYSSEHMTEMIKFFKQGKYKDNKKLFSFFMKSDIDVNVLKQINKSLEDDLAETEILTYLQPEIYVAEQMNELRLFMKQKPEDKDYQFFIFDSDKSPETMKAIRECYNIGLPCNEIQDFDCYSDLYPIVLEALKNGILPNEAKMILDVTTDSKEFAAIVKGISEGLDDDEIKKCLKDKRHLEFNVKLMSEIHDPIFMDKIMSINEIPRRKLLEFFKSEETFTNYLIHIAYSNRKEKQDQISSLLAECGKFDEQRLIYNTGYLDEYIDKALKNEQKLKKLTLKSLLMKEISETYQIDRYNPDIASMKSVLNDICVDRYADLINYQKQMKLFLNRYNDILEIMHEKKDTVKKEDGYMSFDMCHGFSVILKEYQDYYDIEKVVMKYNGDKSCEFTKSQLEKMASEIRKIKMNVRGEVLQRREL